MQQDPAVYGFVANPFDWTSILIGESHESGLDGVQVVPFTMPEKHP
ncbi:hypothetical protein [Methanoregula sp.]